MEKNKRIAIGIENYKEFIDKDFYYVDKTLLIRDLLNLGGKVTLFTRPRRFGKTLALSTIKTFFEKDTDLEGKVTDNAHYFDGMKIRPIWVDIRSSLCLSSRQNSRIRRRRIIR